MSAQAAKQSIKTVFHLDLSDAHPGEEFIYILAGQLTFWIDESERYGLQAGDSLYFRSTRLHRWRNDGDAPTTVLWINVPVVEPPRSGLAKRAAAQARRPYGDATV